jgi:predicted O-methyltransferase YrrM
VKLKGFSRHRLREIEDDTIDFCHIDGSHEAEDVIVDAVLCFWMLKVGGITIFDDYLWVVNKEWPLYKTPAMGIDPFLSIYDRRVEVIHRGQLLVMRRIS